MSGQVCISQKFLSSYCADINLNEMHFNLTFPIAFLVRFHFALLAKKKLPPFLYLIETEMLCA